MTEAEYRVNDITNIDERYLLRIAGCIKEYMNHCIKTYLTVANQDRDSFESMARKFNIFLQSAPRTHKSDIDTLYGNYGDLIDIATASISDNSAEAFGNAIGHWNGKINDDCNKIDPRLASNIRKMGPMIFEKFALSLFRTAKEEIEQKFVEVEEDLGRIDSPSSAPSPGTQRRLLGRSQELGEGSQLRVASL